MTPRVNPIGVSSHLDLLSQSDVTKQLDLMQAAGINWIRLEFKWNKLEPTSGTCDFSNYDFIISNILSRGMSILGLLAQYDVPSWYGTPQNRPPTPADYAAWISQVANRYIGQISLWEIGNEPNESLFWYPSPNASAYTALLQAGYNAIKQVNPSSKVISAGLSQNSPGAFLESMYSAGAKGYFDYLGMHPYNQPNAPDFRVLDGMLGHMSNHGDNKQIIITEVGWPTYSGSGGVTESNQALYIQQVYQMIMHGNYGYVPIACIYDFLDDGTDPNNAEDHFGLLRTDYSQKPSYSTIQSERADYNANFTSINP